MNREDAKAWLSRTTAATGEPPLSSGDLDLLLDTLAPGVTDFDLKTLYRCAAEGWDWKASAAAEGHGRESEVYEHCVERRKFYSAKASGGGATAQAADTDAVKALL